MKEAFEAFARNDRFGTCAECPHDGAGRPLPELCVNTARYDHQIKIGELVRSYHIEAENALAQQIYMDDATIGREEARHLAFIRYHSGWGADLTSSQLLEYMLDDDGKLPNTPAQSLENVRDQLEDK